MSTLASNRRSSPFEQATPNPFREASCGDRTLHVADSNDQHIKNFARIYILSQLRKNNFNDLADELSKFEQPEDECHRHALQMIANQLADERQDQFREILYRLQLNDENLQETYDTVVREIFSDGVHWGRILAFVVFSGSAAVYCAEHHMKPRVRDIVNWTEVAFQSQLWQWIVEKGGWRAFVHHFDDGAWKVELTSLLTGAGLVAAAIAGGMFLLKKLFLD